MDWEERLKKRAADTRSSEELLEAYRKELELDVEWPEALFTIQDRGGKTEFDIAKRLIESENPVDRSIGADILGQIGGYDTPTYLHESVDLLINLLNDSDPDVIFDAEIALGRRHDARAIEPLSKLVEHQDPNVRYALVKALLGFEDELAISILIKLSSDSDRDVRNWAMFGIGSQIDADTPEIREVLFRGLVDEDFEIRGEALVGLARRRDPRTQNAILKEWDGDFISLLSLEAAEELADTSLYRRLCELHSTLDLDDDQSFKNQLERSIEACKPVNNSNNIENKT